MQQTALVIGSSEDASAAAAMLRRAGVVTETKWRGKLKSLLSAANADVVVIADGQTILVRDMVLREQVQSCLQTLRDDLADAFDGYLIDRRDPAVARTLESQALLERR